MKMKTKMKTTDTNSILEKWHDQVNDNHGTSTTTSSAGRKNQKARSARLMPISKAYASTNTFHTTILMFLLLQYSCTSSLLSCSRPMPIEYWYVTTNIQIMFRLAATELKIRLCLLIYSCVQITKTVHGRISLLLWTTKLFHVLQINFSYWYLLVVFTVTIRLKVYSEGLL